MLDQIINFGPHVYTKCGVLKDNKTAERKFGVCEVEQLSTRKLDGRNVRLKNTQKRKDIKDSYFCYLDIRVV